MLERLEGNWIERLEGNWSGCGNSGRLVVASTSLGGCVGVGFVVHGEKCPGLYVFDMVWWLTCLNRCCSVVVQAVGSVVAASAHRSVDSEVQIR